MKNFWKMSDFSLFANSYFYVDHNSYLADSLFEQRKIAMKFKGEMTKIDSPYRIIFCKMLKRDVQKFEDVLEGLYKPDILTDYFEEIHQYVKFKKWFFGHYHDNRNVNAEEILLWEQIIRIA